MFVVSQTLIHGMTYIPNQRASRPAESALLIQVLWHYQEEKWVIKGTRAPSTNDCKWDAKLVETTDNSLIFGSHNEAGKLEMN